jgi:serine/threonine protein kinase
MQKASEHRKLEDYLKYPTTGDEFTLLLDNYNLKKRYEIVALLFHILEKIHIAGLIFSDLSPNNIMVHDSQNNIVFIDTDNLRRKDDPYSGILGTDGYMAPEIYHNAKLSPDTDVFSAAVIAFEILALQHPFIGDAVEEGSAEYETAARHCETEYILTPDGQNESKNPFVKLLEDNTFATSEILSLFKRTFVDGKKNTYLRPAAVEFDEAFSKGLDKIIKCPNCGAYILYNETRRQCWKCDSELPAQIVLDIYDEYAEKDRAALISHITGSNYETGSFTGKNNFLLSSIVFDGNERRCLYLRHFQ